MIEDLLYRIQSNADVTSAEAVIAGLPVEYGLMLDLYFGGEIPTTDIAHLLEWSTSLVSQRLTRGIGLLKYALNPAAFDTAVRILQQLIPSEISGQ